MEELVSAINNFARVGLIIGGAIFTLVVVYAGVLYMMSNGDPQKQNTARTALFSSFIGVFIMALAFLAPRIMTQFVLEPAGLEGVANSGNTGCDQTLRSALVTQRGVGNARQVNSMIRSIQAQRSNDCNSESWSPMVVSGGFGHDERDGYCTDRVRQEAGLPSVVGATEVPSSLLSVSEARLGSSDHGAFARDAEGNILLQFADNAAPTDGSLCWMYLARSNFWSEEVKGVGSATESP